MRFVLVLSSQCRFPGGPCAQPLLCSSAGTTPMLKPSSRSRLLAGLPWCSLFPCTSYPTCCAEAYNSSNCHFRLRSSDLLLFFPKHMCSKCLPFALTHNSVNGRVNKQGDCSIAIVSLLLHISVHPLSIVRYLIHNHKTHSQLKAFSFPKTTSKNPIQLVVIKLRHF